MGFKYFEIYLSFFFLKTLKIKGISFSDYLGIEFGIFILGEGHSENVKRKTTKFPAGVRKIEVSLTDIFDCGQLVTFQQGLSFEIWFPLSESKP